MITRTDDRWGLLDASTASALLGVDLRTIRNDRARHGIGQGKGKVGYGAWDLVVVAVRRSFPGAPADLKERLRRDRFQVRIQIPVEAPGSAPEIVVDASPVAKWVQTKVMAFRRGARRVISDPKIQAGVPVFRGTRIPVEQIGQMLLKGATEDDLLADFPSLSRDDLEYAHAVVRRRPAPGRPRKSIELRR